MHVVSYCSRPCISFMANGFAEHVSDWTRRSFFGILGVKVTYQFRAARAVGVLLGT